MLEMAKMNDLNIDRYLKVLLKYWSTTDEQLAELAPWSEKLWSIKNRMRIIVNYSNLKMAGVILYSIAFLLIKVSPIYSYSLSVIC